MITGVISPNMVHRRALHAAEILGPATDNNMRHFQKKRVLIIFDNEEPSRLCYLEKMYCPSEIRGVLKREMPDIYEHSLEISAAPNENITQIDTKRGKIWIAHVVTPPTENCVIWSTTRHSGPTRAAQPQEFFVVSKDITPPQFLSAYFAHVLGMKHNQVAYTIHFACGDLIMGSARCDSHFVTFGRKLLSDASSKIVPHS